MFSFLGIPKAGGGGNPTPNLKGRTLYFLPPSWGGKTIFLKPQETPPEKEQKPNLIIMFFASSLKI